MYMEIGTYESDSETNDRIRRHFAEAKGIDVPLLERIARTALPPFPELMLGEYITASEIKRRLGEIREAGYDMKPYSGLSGKEARQYLRKIQREIRDRAKEHCPGILNEIAAQNKRAKDESYLFR